MSHSVSQVIGYILAVIEIISIYITSVPFNRNYRNLGLRVDVVKGRATVARASRWRFVT